MKKLEEFILFQPDQSPSGILDNYEIKMISVAGDKLCLSRIGEQLFVFEPFCPHFDYPLQNGKINGHKQIICAWHGYQFDLETGKESRKRCRPLNTYPTYKNQEGAIVLRYSK